MANLKIETIEDMFKLMEAIEVVTNAFSSIESEEKAKRKQLSDSDIKLQDLLHEAELVSLSRREKINLFNAITQERQNRRKLKNIIELLEPCYRLSQSSGAKTVAHLKDLCLKLKSIKELQLNRTYTAKSGLKKLKISREKYHLKSDK